MAALNMFSRPEAEAELAGARTIETLEAALRRVIELRRELKAPDLYGRALEAPALDALVPRMATRLQLKDVPGVRSNDNVCLLATAVYGTGGHTRVVADFMKGMPEGRKPVLVMSDVYDEMQYRTLLNDRNNNSGLGERAVIISTGKTLIDRALQLYMSLAAMRPTRIVLLCHPMDIVALTVAWPFRDIVEFVHHSDHFPAIGVGLPWADHVDLTYTCHKACHERSSASLYAGMSAVVGDPAEHKSNPKRLRFASCGSLHKFTGVMGQGWADYVSAALRRPGSEFFHIGPTTPEFETAMRGVLQKNGIDPARYHFNGFAPSLPAELAKLGIDIYLSSFPEPGGKANLEAMAAGVPVIVATSPTAPPLTRFSLPLSRYIGISHPKEMAQAIDKALLARKTFSKPEKVEELNRELGRFDAFIEGRLGPEGPQA